MSMGTAHWISRNRANTRFPIIAPNLADTRVTAIAVDLRWVGKTSTPGKYLESLFSWWFHVILCSPRQSKLLKPMVETAPKIQERTRFMTVLSTM